MTHCANVSHTLGAFLEERLPCYKFIRLLVEFLGQCCSSLVFVQNIVIVPIPKKILSYNKFQVYNKSNYNLGFELNLVFISFQNELHYSLSSHSDRGFYFLNIKEQNLLFTSFLGCVNFHSQHQDRTDIDISFITGIVQIYRVQTYIKIRSVLKLYRGTYRYNFNTRVTVIKSVSASRYLYSRPIV